MYRTVVCSKIPVQHQCIDMMGLCIILYVFFVAQTITNTTKYSHATKIHCMCFPLHDLKHIESVLIVFHTLKIFCCQTQNDYSPVYAASLNGHTEVVDLLVEAGADIHLATTMIHVSTYTVSSLVAAVVETGADMGGGGGGGGGGEVGFGSCNSSKALETHREQCAGVQYSTHAQYSAA